MPNISPLASLKEGSVHFVRDGKTGKFHLGMKNSPMFFLCGINGAMGSEVVDNDTGFGGLLSSPHLPGSHPLVVHFKSSAICGNCRASLVARLKKADLSLQGLFGTRLQEARQQSQEARQRQVSDVLKWGRTKAKQEQVGPIEANMVTGLLVATSSENKEYDVTKEIFVNIKIGYDLEDICITEIVDAIEYLKEKANDHGSVEEITLTTNGSLDVEIPF
jgi:hypothetical protein